MEQHSSEHSPMTPHAKAVVGKTPTDGLSPELVAPKGYLSFVEARQFAMSLNLKTRKEWRQYIKGDLGHLVAKPENIPAHPDGIYKVKGWQGWKYWLGTVGSHE